MTHPNADTVRGGYEAFARGDIGAVMGLLADDIVWHIGGRSPLAGDYRGHEGVMAFFGLLMELSGGTFRLDVHDVAATDAHVLAIVDYHAERGDRSIAGNAIHVWHMADGAAVEFRSVAVDPYTEDAFWS